MAKKTTVGEYNSPTTYGQEIQVADELTQEQVAEILSILGGTQVSATSDGHYFLLEEDAIAYCEGSSLEVTYKTYNLQNG